MSKHKNLKRNLLICLLAGSAVMYTLPLHAATSVIANNTLPMGEDSLTQNHTFDRGNLEMTITQNGSNGIIKWDSFNVGGSATVNFKGPQKGYNTLNYVNGANMSQIYGTINANNNGNIFIVNPAGVQIGNSAQINVGSLHVSNAKVTDEYLKTVNKDTTVNKFLQNAQMTNAALMSLGNINAGEVTFEGNGRIVIDSERIKDAAGDEKLNYQNINIKTSETNKNNIIIGYEAYDETITNGSVVGYDNKNTDEVIATVTTENGTSQYKKANGYMWVEDVEQLQAIGKNANTLSGNYALRNSIDATSTANWNEVNGTYAGFNPIGLDETTGKVIVNNNNEYGFTGNFDGLDYNIFGLTINRESEANVGLFGVAHNANINNVTLVGGSITGGSVVGSVIGAALGNTHITNATNSASVTGNTDVGGIVGYSGDKLDNDGSEIKVEEGKSRFTNLINTGSVYSKGEQGTKASNAGGLIGYMYNGTLDGNSYNLGNVSGKGYNVGGLVGHAVNSVIGNPSVVDGKPVENVQVVYNRLDVSGAYNVGGIVGNMKGSTVQNAENSGTVEATGYTTEGYTYHTGVRNSGSLPSGTLNVGTVTTTVNIANAGGIAGTSSDSEIVKVTNTADVSTATETGTQYTVNDLTYYTAGNVGGIVGRAEDTNISDATNRENEMRGAHNVGGVAGYFGGTGTVSGGINDGGDIMATGARYNDNFVRELIRPVGDSNESFIIGNIGGVVGYMDGDNVYVTGSANRGTVHSQDIEEENAINVLYTSQAANVGGVVGKIDRSDTKGLVEIKNNTSLAAVNNSYNTGDVRGYTGVGGVVGMMYNGEVASSYNLGYLRTTRIATNGENIEAVNMGGIVGDTTEGSHSKGVIIYDVYNKGQIGDDTYTYYARHVAGIVGRLSGTVEKAYNNGEIYNGYTATGGIAGWMYEGSINNAFNTGNITVYNHDSSTSQVGGIVGAASVASGDINLTNVYNLGTLRSFQANSTYAKLNHNVGANSVAGIIGAVMNNRHDLIIKNAYTTGNIYAGNQDDSGNINLDKNNDMVGSIYGENRGVKNNNTGNMEYADINRTNTYYIRPENGIGFTQLGTNNYGSDNSNKGIYYNQRFNSSEYSYNNRTGSGSLSFSSQSGGDVRDNTDSNWRLYPNGTPILNAFLPNTENYFSKTENMSGISSIQYGTAYDPLLTIINAANETNNLSYNWSDLGISNAAGIAVYGAGLTLENVNTSGSSSGYYGGLIYSDGVLTINAANNEGLAFGSGADIYGSSVALNADGTITIYGDVTATGNGTAANDDPDKAGSINIASNDSDINVYGTLTSATAGESVTIPGISGAPDSNWRPVDTGDSISDPSDNLNTIGERYEHTTTASAVNGNITIEAGTWTDADKDGIQDAGEVTGGNIGLYYGNKGEGITTTGGNLTITGTGDVYVDSDLDIGGDLTLEGTGADSEVVLDITNIGQVQAKNELAENPESQVTAAEKLHKFMHHFENTNADTDNLITLNSASGDAKLAVDMWDGNAFNLSKFDSKDHNFKNELDSMNVTVNGKELDGKENNHVKDYTYIWVSDGEQLKGIQQSAKVNNDFLDFNFVLKNDINASDVKDYVAIGTGSEFTGTFDGRGNRIIGLTVDGKDTANAGIFDTIGTNGVVKDVNIYSGNFTGTNNAGAVAGVNNGRIEGIVTFGNTVKSDDNAGGIVGFNNSGKFSVVDEETGSTNGGELTGGIYDVESTGSVIAGSSTANAGGLIGINDGALGNSFSDSAVTVQTGVSLGATAGLGGVVGVNNGDVQVVDSLGVTNGGDSGSSDVGGIIGINNGNMYSGYNESIVSGKDNVGGIIGNNNGGKNFIVKDDETIIWSKGTVENIVNATGVTGTGDYIGGLLGTNVGSVENGRNNGTITGHDYVGGLVGNNAYENSVLTNLTNDSSAEILGVEYVGGIAGSNAGTITADKENDNLVNRGSITGHTYVGGVAGLNTGTITNTNNDVELHVNTAVNGGSGAKYFGGVVGQNGTDSTNSTGINDGVIENATNTNTITAPDAEYVGGIVGWNTSQGKLIGMGNSNEGTVIGGSYVGGVIGKNDAAIGSEKDAQVGVTNEGTVIATQGGAGGLIGENNAAITNTVMTNHGEVHGNNTDDENSGTGGLIGVNSGNITYSSLINEATGTVTGTHNVGGLIGINTGKIEGGRYTVADEDAGMYINKIYNNGVINVGTYTDADSNGEYEFTAATEGDNSKNIGGLIGENATGGSLTAGYNTGAINAENSSNVGGIAGSNSGTIDQVFNTVYNTDGTKGAITGGTNVGGLVGTNSGTLSNAYNTTDVFGNSVFGNAVGNNTAKGTIKNIYASNNSGKLIGENINQSADAIQKAYSFVNGDTSATKIISGEDQKDSGSYAGFDFANGTWKNYDENGNPLLKVFLTDVTINVDVDKINKYINNVYNGDAQYITDEDIDKLIAQGAITAPDNFTAYKNAKELINSISHTNAGTYNDWLYSGQIAEATGNTFNPNNLGYDIELSASIAQKELTISDILANIVYGGNTYTDIKGGALTGIVNNDDVYLVDKNGNNISITSDFIADYLFGEYATKKGDRNTANVKRDQDNNVIAYGGAIYVDGISLGGAALGNYKLADKTIGGDITVTPATLNITLNDIYRIYGDHSTIYGNYEATQNGDYGIKDVNGLVNGDQNSLESLIVKAISDGALDNFANPTKTNDVKKDGYKWSGDFSGIDNVNSNYTITVDGGNSIVKAKTITIKDLLASIVYGNQDNKGLQINTGASLADGSIVYGDDLDVSLVVDNAQYTTGGAYEDNKGGRTTADVGEYTNSLFVSGLSLTGDKAGNYVLDTTAAVGDIKVTKANLIINVGNAETVYGDAFNDNDYTHTLSGVTNGDSDTVIDGLLGGNYDNTVSVEAGKDTANAGTYKDALGFVNYQQLKNYEVQVENGDVIINKKQITIGANNEQIFVGETPNYSGTDINGVLVNGDSLNGNYHYGVADGTVESETGTHTGVIGIWIGGVFYDLSQNVDWTQAGSFFSNYEVNSTPGTLTVSAYDIPEDWPHNRWDYLFNDAPFDRNKDFRERKAEVNFVDGGMEI